MDKENLLGYKWAKEVVEGKFIANKWVELECKRYIDRLDNGLDSELIEFDFKEADIIYKLLACINYATGFYANKPVINHAAGFQMMVWENIFCWFYKELDETGFRKKVIEEVYLEIGRKSAKSFLCAVTEILILLRSPKFAQTATAGKTRDISSLVKQATIEIINASPLIQKHFKITREKIECKLNNATMKALSGEANNINGLLLSSFIVDEVANQEDSSIIGALKLSQMNTKDRLSIYISTQYDLEFNAFNELLEYHKSILNGVDKTVINTFGLLFELDEGDDFNNESNWIKASPLQMTMQNGIEFLRQEYKKGLTVPSAMTEFRIKILNERLGSNEDDKYLDFNYWKKCCSDKINFEGKDVVIGMDLSVSTDLTAVGIGYREGEKFYYKSIGFLPKGTLNQRREKIDYLQMQRNGYCKINEGMTVSYTEVENYIRSIEETYKCKIKSIVTDPYNAKQLAENLAQDYDVIMLKQTYTNLSPSVKDFRKQVYDGNIVYEKNTLLDWNVSNAITIKGRSDDEMLQKENKNKQRIDMLVVLIFIHSELHLIEQEYDAIKALETMNW